MRVLDGCVIVLDGVRGVEPQTETVWRQRTRFRLPALFFINKLDRPGADFDRALATVRDRLAVEPVAVTVPAPDYDGSVIHLIDQTRLRFSGEKGEQVDAAPCDAASWEWARHYRENLLLAAAELDDALAEQVLAEEEPEAETVWAALRRATLTGKGLSLFRRQRCAIRAYNRCWTESCGCCQPRPNSHRAWRISPAVVREGRGDGCQRATGGAGVQRCRCGRSRRHVFARLYRGTLKPGDDVCNSRPERDFAPGAGSAPVRGGRQPQDPAG